jgi:site-specific recombinase XerD
VDKAYVRKSPVAEYIDGLLNEKRALGYSYLFEEYLLNEFDNYCIEKGLSTSCFSRDFLSDWLTVRNGEGASYHSQRISFVRQLALYMNSLGINAYIPVETVKKEQVIPHFLSREELVSFFEMLDHDVPRTTAAYAWRLWNEYRVIFRLLYCCGLRNSEACCLRPGDVDLISGRLSIIHSKGDKDRTVYMEEDLQALMYQYWEYLTRELGFTPQWFFPSSFPDRHIHKATLDDRFNRAWNLTPFASACPKKPTVHCLRHSFVVDRMNAWAKDGLSYGQMLPYLSKYLGHRGVGESLYYFHLSEEANALIRRKDRTAGRVIPGVEKYAR